MEWLTKSTWHRVIVSAVFAALVCLFLACCVHVGNTDDDWSISLFLSGRIDGGGLSLFIGAPLSQIIFLLNSLAPSLNWFFVLEHLTALLSFWLLCYAALTWSGMASGFAVTGAMLAFILPNCISTSNFTYVAFLAVASGEFLLVASIRDPDAGAPAFLLAVALVALGSLWRLQMMLLSMPFFAVATAWSVWSERDDRALVTRRAAISALSILVACGLLYAYDRAVWQQDGWREWEAYNGLRAEISDYPMPKYDEISGELANLGISENDYALLKGWSSGDTDTLDTELIQQVVDLRKETPLSLPNLLTAAQSYFERLVSRPQLMLTITVTLALVLRRNALGHQAVLIAPEIALAFAACTYFSLTGRLPNHVEEPAWFYAALMVVAAAGSAPSAAARGDLRSASPIARARCAAGVAMLVGGTAYMGVCALPHLSVDGLLTSFSQGGYYAPGAITACVRDNPDLVFVADSGTYYQFEEEYGLRYLPAEDVANRIMPLGGWGSGSPLRRAQCELVGARNPYEALLSGDSTRLIAYADVAERVLLFLREHYDPGAEMVQAGALDGASHQSIWRFSASGLES